MSGAGITIGSRGSALAMAQATMVQRAFLDAGHHATIVVIQTEGDRRAPDTSWGEGAFVSAIEQALVDGRVDVAVHSAKDIPTDEDRRLRIAAYLPRADPRDALVVRVGQAERRLDELPAGARVGTDSPRRTGFLRARRPDLRFHELNGNVDTRLRRLDDGETDALVLACAGLERLGRADRIGERFEPDVVPPAPGQGAIAVQVRSDDDRLLAFSRTIDDAPTRAAVEAERAFLRASGGGCRSPIGAYARCQDETLDLLAGHVQPDGSRVIIGRQAGSSAEPRELGQRLAAALLPSTTRASAADPHPREAPRVLVTRAAGQAGTVAAALRVSGIEVVHVPAIEIEPVRDPELDRVVAALPSRRWAVVTSPNGARSVAATARRLGIELPARFVAVGEATGAALQREGFEVAFVPAEANAASIAAELPVEPGDAIALLQGDLADGTLADRLRARGATIDTATAYRTREAPRASEALLRSAFEVGPIAAIVFTSGSTVRGLCALAEAISIDIAPVPAICIGKETARAATEAGFTSVSIASAADAAALASAAARGLAGTLQEIA